MKNTIIRKAIQIAQNKNNNHPMQTGFRHYTFVIQNNTIIEIGMNRKAEIPKHLGYSNFSGIHSEIDAMRKARGILDFKKPIELINIRLNRNGTFRMSKPCKNCYNWLTAFNCKTILYSTDTGFERINIK